MRSSLALMMVSTAGQKSRQIFPLKGVYRTSTTMYVLYVHMAKNELFANTGCVCRLVGLMRREIP